MALEHDIRVYTYQVRFFRIDPNRFSKYQMSYHLRLDTLPEIRSILWKSHDGEKIQLKFLQKRNRAFMLSRHAGDKIKKLTMNGTVVSFWSIIG